MKRNAILAILAVGLAALSFWAGGRYAGRPFPEEGERSVLYYVDPMNPGFRSPTAGVAPCGMPLEPVYADAGAGGGSAAMPLPHGAVSITAARQQLIGVKVAQVEVRPMTHTLRLYGRIVPDETRLYRINASTDSWIRTLSDVATGSIVNKNEILAEALAPAFYNAQVTYLVAMDNVDRIRQQLGGELRHQQADLADNQIRLAVQALQNLGITDSQVEQLAHSRKARPYLQVRAPARGVVLNRNLTLNQWFRAGDEFYRIADISRVWVYADVYENDARHLQPGMKVTIRHPQMGKTFHARVSDALPLFDPASRTLKVRIDVDNPRYELRPDMFVDVEIPIILSPSVYLTADAVIDSGTRSIVYVDSGDGTFEPRQVDTGWKLGRQIEITRGLMPGDKVVVSGNFLIDSESRMKTAGAGTETRMARDPVCGMDVDEWKAQSEGRSLVLGDTTYYFCCQKCLQRFRDDPATYRGEDQPVPAGHVQATPSVKERDRVAASAKDPVCGMQVDERKAQGAGRTVTLEGTTYYFCAESCRTAFLRGVENNASRPVAKKETGQAGENAKEWRGWGRFPGAEYLGLKDRAGPRPTPGTEERRVEETEGGSPGHDTDMRHAVDDRGGQAR